MRLRWFGVVGFMLAVLLAPLLAPLAAAGEAIPAATPGTPVAGTPAAGEMVVGGAVAGNAFDLLPPGSPGEVSVLAAGPGGVGPGGLVAVVVVNRTDQPVGSLVLAVRLVDGDGATVGTAGDLEGFYTSGTDEVQPSILMPGEVGLALYEVAPDAAGDAAAVEATVVESYSVSGDLFPTVSPDVVALEPGDVGPSGTIANPDPAGSFPLGLIAMTVACFDDGGAITQAGTTIPNPQTLARGEEGGFAFGRRALDPAIPCDRFLVAGNGL